MKLEYTNENHEDEVISENHEIEIPETTTQTDMRRSERMKRAPDYYGERVNVTNGQSKEPTTLLQVLTKKNGLKPWKRI